MLQINPYLLLKSVEFQDSWTQMYLWGSLFASRFAISVVSAIFNDLNEISSFSGDDHCNSSISHKDQSQSKSGNETYFLEWETIHINCKSIRSSTQYSEYFKVHPFFYWWWKVVTIWWFWVWVQNWIFCFTWHWLWKVWGQTSWVCPWQDFEYFLWTKFFSTCWRCYMMVLCSFWNLGCKRGSFSSCYPLLKSISLSISCKSLSCILTVTVHLSICCNALASNCKEI